MEKNQEPTKVKNPKRVAQGKKLAEYNKLKKEQLKKTSEVQSATDISQDVSQDIPTEIPTEIPTNAPKDTSKSLNKTTTALVLFGTVIGGCALAALYFNQRGENLQSSKPLKDYSQPINTQVPVNLAESSQNDIFDMD